MKKPQYGAFSVICNGVAGSFLAAVMFVVAQPALAKEKIKDKGDKYEYKYKDSRCDYHYKFNYRTGKTDVKEKGDCGHIAPPFKPVSVFQMPRTVPPVAGGTTGRCDREQIGRVLGGIAGGVVGSQIGKDRDKVLTTAGGILVGVIIGGEIGRRMDEGDHACVSQALEFAQPQQAVRWDADGVSYAVVPAAPSMVGGSICRAFEVRSKAGGQERAEQGRACRQADGTWIRV